jgi:hypothetical protein
MARDPEINLCSLRIGGEWAGLAFVAITLLIIVGGLPSARWFFVASLAGGVTVGAALAWCRRHP